MVEGSKASVERREAPTESLGSVAVFQDGLRVSHPTHGAGMRVDMRFGTWADVCTDVRWACAIHETCALEMPHRHDMRGAGTRREALWRPFRQRREACIHSSIDAPENADGAGV